MLFQILLFSLLLLLYYFSPDRISSSFLLIVISIAALSLILLLNKRKKSFLRKTNVSVTIIFIFLFFIVNFQIPLDYILENDFLDFNRYFYDYDIVNKSVTFSALCFTAFSIGTSAACKKYTKLDLIVKNTVINSFKVPTGIILLVTIIFFVLFLVNINAEFINGGHGTETADSFAMTCYVLYLRFSILYIAFVIYNYSTDKAKKTKFSFLRRFSPLFIFSVVISSLLFLFAHNRVFVIYLLTPLIIAYVIYYKKKVNLIYLIILLTIIACFFTLFKVFGIEMMISEFISLKGNIRNIENYRQFTSFSPFTVELAYSIHSNTVLYYLWDKGVFFYGISLFVGILKTIPGLVALFLTVTGLSITNIDTGDFVTKYTDSPYGLGTTCVADLLINIGFLPTLIFFCMVGFLFTKCELFVFSGRRYSIYYLVTYLTISSQIVFIPRGSFTELIGFVLFNLMCTKILLLIFTSSNEKNTSYNQPIG